jgi:hypothetical protein
MKATENFDPGKGKFGTYAFWWVKAYILRAIRQNSLVHVPSKRQKTNRPDKQDAPYCRMVDLEECATVPPGGTLTRLKRPAGMRQNRGFRGC